MSYGMVGGGRFSQRLCDWNKLRNKALGLLQISERGTPAYDRRLKRKESVDALYSQVYSLISNGKLRAER